MPLRSRRDFHNVFFEAPALLLDTCAITWFAKQDNGIALFDRTMARYRLLIPTPVLYELAFGTSETVHVNERLLRDRLFDPRTEVNLHAYGRARQEGRIQAGGCFIVNPTHLEWWSARDRLLRYVTLSGSAAGKSKQNYSLDALIHSCARNSFSPICTMNVRDFMKLNKAANLVAHDKSVPVFTPEQVLASITDEIYFEETA